MAAVVVAVVICLSSADEMLINFIVAEWLRIECYFVYLL